MKGTSSSETFVAILHTFNKKKRFFKEITSKYVFLGCPFFSCSGRPLFAKQQSFSKISYYDCTKLPLPPPPHFPTCIGAHVVEKQNRFFNTALTLVKIGVPIPSIAQIDMLFIYPTAKRGLLYL